MYHQVAALVATTRPTQAVIEAEAVERSGAWALTPTRSEQVRPDDILDALRALPASQALVQR